MLRQLRWRAPPRDRRRLWLALAVVLLLHGWFGWVIWQQMRPAPVAPITSAQPAEVMEVRFIPHSSHAQVSPAPAVPNLPPLQAPAKAAPPRPHPPVHAEPVAKDAMTIRLPEARAAQAPSPKLFDKTGQAILPTSATSVPAAPEAAYIQRMPTDSDKVMQHTTPVKYAPTRFEKDWHRTDVVDDTLQKAVDATTAKHTFNLPRGIHIHCSIGLTSGGCGGDPPPPPSKKDGDERLSMAPAKPIATDPHPPVPPTLEACIAMYRAAKPLEHGCPIDTPNRSADQDMADRAKAAANPSARHVQTPGNPGN
jgi:hypothetical protein